MSAAYVADEITVCKDELVDVVGELDGMRGHVFEEEWHTLMGLADRVFAVSGRLEKAEKRLTAARDVVVASDASSATSRIAALERTQTSMLQTISALVARLPPTSDPLEAAARVEVCRRAVAAGGPTPSIGRLLDSAESLANSLNPTPLRIDATAGGAGAGAPPAPKRAKRSKSVDLCDHCDADEPCEGYGVCACKCHWCTKCWNACTKRCSCQCHGVQLFSD